MEGAPFSSLPAALQARTIALFRKDSLSDLIKSQQRLYDVMTVIDGVKFTFAPGTADAKPPQFFGAFQSGGFTDISFYDTTTSRLRAYTADGQIITDWLTGFRASLPGALDIEQEKYRADGEEWRKQQPGAENPG